MYILIAASGEEVMELKDLEKDHLVISGLGKLNAALALSDCFHKCKRDIHGVINLGTAGSERVPSGSLLEVVRSYQRDTSFFSDSIALEGYSKLAKIHCGSGDRIEAIKDSDPWDIVDMELYSLAFFCKNKSVPLVSIKYVTDRNDVNVYKEWKKQLPIASKALAEFWMEEKQQILSKLCPK
jgi:nucleoside phosphorylase